MIINLLNYLKSLIIKCRLTIIQGQCKYDAWYLRLSSLRWGQGLRVPLLVSGPVSYATCSHSYIIILPIWLWTYEPCALSYGMIDRLVSCIMIPPLKHMSLRLRPRSCLDWRSTGGASQGVRPDRELWLTAHFDKMKEVVAADEIYLPWAAKENNIKWKSILTEINEAIKCEEIWNEKMSQFLHYNVLFHL